MRPNRGLPLRQRSARLSHRVLAVLGPDASGAGQSLAALAINSSTSFVAGAILASITGTFEDYPGLLVMVPAAIGLRGNVFSALGSRISTSIHTGDYRTSLRPGSVMGDNTAASLALTLLLSMVIALVAASVSAAFGIAGEVSVLSLATISILGGLLASAVVLAVTLALVVLAVRAEWDLDRLVAPVVSTVGDVVTVPALWLAAFTLGHGSWSTASGGLLIAGAATAAAVAWRTSHDRLRRIVRESVPVLAVAAVLSTLAGLVLEKQLGVFQSYGAILVLMPAFVSSAGALGGVLASSLATGLHLGTIDPSVRPARAVWRDARGVALLAVPVYLFNGVGAHLVGAGLGEASPGLGPMVAASLLGAVGAVSFVVAVAYYGSVAAVRFRVDPDSYGIPIVTSSVDFVGAVALILALTALAIR